MHPDLNHDLAETLTRDRLERAERARLAHDASKHQEPAYDCVTVRRAWPDDALAIRRLEELEGRRLPAGPALVAEVDREVLAARSLNGDPAPALANPFSQTAELVALLHVRAAHLKAEPRLRDRALLRSARSLARLLSL
jgi:hypothetical protein